MVGSRVAVLILAPEVDVGAQVEVDLAVAIVVGRSHAGEGSLGRGCEPKGTRAVAEPARSVVDEQQRPAGSQRDEILDSRVAQVEKQGLAGVVEDSYASFVGAIQPATVFDAAIEPVRQAPGLANVNLVPSVPIDISDRDALVAVHIDARRGIQLRAPVRNSLGQLLADAWRGIEQIRGHVAEERLGRAHQRLVKRLEPAQGSSPEGHSPVADAVLQTVVGLGTDFEPHHLVGQCMEERSTYAAEGCDPACKALCETLVGCLVASDRHAIGVFVPGGHRRWTAKARRHRQTPPQQCRPQNLLDLHAATLAGEGVISRVHQWREVGARAGLAEAERKVSSGGDGRGAKRRTGRQTGQEIAAIQYWHTRNQRSPLASPIGLHHSPKRGGAIPRPGPE